MISADNLQKSFGRQTLFEDAGFKVNPRERIGLVGRNGHGKTTLIRMMTGEEHPDSGAITLPRHYRMGYVRQTIAFTQDTVLKEGCLGLSEAERDQYWKVEKILTGLGFSQEDMQLSPDLFSGGYQVRLNLAKVLVSEPDLLLLDEPTNYLDITSIRWIEGFLRRWPRELILITHDRGFMDKVITHVIGIQRRKFRKVAGDTGKYYEQIAQEDEIYEKTRVNDERRRKEIELFITRFRAKARLANLVQSRMKTLAKMDKKEKLVQLKNLEFEFRSKPHRSRHVFTVENLNFGYEARRPLINDFNVTVEAGERICVVGKNGRGKTTLLKLIAKALRPKRGSVKYHPAVEEGFFEQTNIKTLHDDHTVLEEVLYAAEGVDQQLARNICGNMLFAQDAALKKISVLSGGEKSRVVLGKILATPVNLLLLDEPTNHLDMDACDALLAAIDAFEGTVLMVTHNEMFLHALAQRLIVFQDDRVSVFDGTYQEFLNKVGWADEMPVPKAGAVEAVVDIPIETPVVPAGPKLSKKALRRRKSEIITQRGKALKPFGDRIAWLEEDIDAQEKKIERLNTEMLKATEAQDGAKIAEVGQALHACQSLIDTHFEELEEKTLALEEKKATFDRQLSELEGG